MNLVSIVEIPVNDFSRAVTFYKDILAVPIEEVDMGDTKMGVFPSDGDTVNVVLVKGSDYNPVSNGVLVYFNASDDLQPVLAKIEPAGGKVILEKTEISPEMGFFALFLDSEGNRVGLYAKS